MSTIGEKIRLHRKAAKMTQAQLAEIVGISRVTVTQYESGTITPPIDKLEKIAAALGCQVTELISPQEYFSRGMAELQKELKQADQIYIETLSRPALELNHIGKIALLKAAYSMAEDPDYTEPDIEKMLELWNIPIDELNNGK